LQARRAHAAQIWVICWVICARATYAADPATNRS
jgi:hypothetical protein